MLVLVCVCVCVCVSSELLVELVFFTGLTTPGAQKVSMNEAEIDLESQGDSSLSNTHSHTHSL